MSPQRAFADSAYGSRDGPVCTLLKFPFSLGTQTKLFLSVPAAFLLLRMLERRATGVFDNGHSPLKSGYAAIGRVFLPSKLEEKTLSITAGTLCL